MSNHRPAFQVVTYDVPTAMIIGITQARLTLEEAHRIADRSNAAARKHPSWPHWRNVVVERPR